MDRFVALLRGINVGGRKIDMAELEDVFNGLGYKNVSTILRTGNVVFDAHITDISKERQKIETALKNRFNYAAISFLYDIEEIAEAVNNYPFDPSDEDYQHYVVFLEIGIAEELVKEIVDIAIERIKREGHNIYWLVKKGYSVKSDFSKYLAKTKYRDFNTVRNLNTLQKLI